MTAVRIANCAGSLWDRFSGLRDALAGPVDVVTGDYLADPTLRQLALEKKRDPELGYARSFLAQFTDAVGLLVERDAGHDLVVAHVEGDDVLGRLGEFGPLEHRSPRSPTTAPR